MRNFVRQKEQQQGVETAGVANSERSFMEAFEKLKEENRNLRVRSMNLQLELEALKRRADLIEASNNLTWQRRGFREKHEQPGQLVQKDICKQYTEIVARFRNMSFLLNCLAMLSALLLVCEEKVVFLGLILVASVALVISGSSALIEMFNKRNMYEEEIKANTRGADSHVSIVMMLELMKLIGFFVFTSMYLMYLIYSGVYSGSTCKGPQVPQTSILPACFGMRCIIVQKIVQW